MVISDISRHEYCAKFCRLISSIFYKLGDNFEPTRVDTAYVIRLTVR